MERKHFIAKTTKKIFLLDVNNKLHYFIENYLTTSPKSSKKIEFFWRTRVKSKIIKKRPENELNMVFNNIIFLFFRAFAQRYPKDRSSPMGRTRRNRTSSLRLNHISRKPAQLVTSLNSTSTTFSTSDTHSVCFGKNPSL